MQTFGMVGYISAKHHQTFVVTLCFAPTFYYGVPLVLVALT